MIICAAIRVDHIVICGLRHCDCYETLHELNPELYRQVCSTWNKTEEGFMTHSGEFLNRNQAYIHAYKCGQISSTVREEKTDTQLYSEDLY